MSQNLEASQKTFERGITVQEQELRASYLVSYRLAKSKKAHTVAEELILPNDTVQRRICDMSNDVEQQLTELLTPLDVLPLYCFNKSIIFCILPLSYTFQ